MSSNIQDAVSTARHLLTPRRLPLKYGGGGGGASWDTSGMGEGGGGTGTVKRITKDQDGHHGGYGDDEHTPGTSSVTPLSQQPQQLQQPSHQQWTQQASAPSASSATMSVDPASPSDGDGGGDNDGPPHGPTHGATDSSSQGVRPLHSSNERGTALSPSSSVAGLGGSHGGVPWAWVPRGGAPACRLVSQVALEAARFGEPESTFAWLMG